MKRIRILFAAFSLVAAAPDWAMAQVQGDFNGDGVGDLAIGTPNESVTSNRFVAGTLQSVTTAAAGSVTVIFGTAASGVQISAGSPQPQFIHQDVEGVENVNEANDRFGAAMAAGDFNGDDFDDLIVFVPGDNAIQIFHGSSTGLDLAGDRMIDGTPFFDNQGNPMPILMRPALVRGNFNGDAFDDLAVAALVPADFLGRPSVLVMSGGATGVQSFSGRIFTFNISAIAIEVGERRETSLAVGDFSGDGADDLAVGLPDLDVGDETGVNMLDAGAVTILQGLPATGGPTTGGITVQGATSLTELDASSAPQMGEGFGAVLAAGDFDGNGVDDLAVGAPDEGVLGNIPSFTTAVEGGIVFVFSQATTLHAIYTQLPFFMNPQSFDRFGAALAAADFNGDGADDLAIGTPGDLVNSQARAGSVTVLFGLLNLGLPRPGMLGLAPINGTVRTFTQLTTDISDDPQSGDQFGLTLSAGDVGRTAHADLIIGVPDEDVFVVVGGNLQQLITETRANAGAVHVLFGSNAVLQGAGSQFLTQNTTGVPDSVEVGDRFGSSLPR
jgi:hypothetical protein